MLNAHEFNLFITPGSMPPVLHMAQYDSGRQWTAKLKADDGNAYTPASGATAKVEGVNGKGVAWELTATISGSSVIFTPSEAATDQFGKYEATLTIEKSGEQITALCLLFDIQKAGITNEEAAASPEFQTAMEAAAADAVEEAMTEAGILLAENQAEKTAAMTNPVGVDENGKLWCEPGESGQTQAAVLYDQNQSLNSTQKATARGNIDAYTKPAGGIPKADLASGVQTSLGKADTALQSVTAEAVLGAAEDFTSEQKPVFRGYIGAGTYSKPSGGIPDSDLAGDIPANKLASAVQTSLGKADGSLQTANLTAKTSAMTQAVGYDSSTGKLYTAPGSGGGGGIALTVLYAAVDTTSDPVVSLYDSSNNPVSYNDLVAAMAGDVRIVTIPDPQSPNDGWLWYIDDMSASADFVSLHAVIPGQGANTLYTAELTESSGLLTGPMYSQTIGKGNAMLPTAQTKTATNMSNGFSVTANYIYTVSGECSGFAITNQSISFTTGLCAEIILTVGSTAISSPTWPSAAKFMDGWDGKLSANTEYDIIIDWAGRVYHSERAVSA